MSRHISVWLAAATIAFAGCSKQRQAASPTAAAPPPAVRAAPAGELRLAGTQALRQSATVLEELTRLRSEAIPDAVLSRAKCLVVLPAAGKQADREVLATAACRSGNNWGTPTFAKLTRPSSTTGPHRKGADLLIFMMSARAQQALLAGTVRFGSDISVGAGPVLEQGPIVTDVELKSSDGLAYLHSDGKLEGVTVASGTLQLDAEVSTRVYGGAGVPKALLMGRTAKSSAANSYNIMVNSFFYLIRPAGIIIHHSVLVPEPAVVEQELDQFHSKRGFSINCFGRVYHVAYHYLVLPDGRTQAGRPERCQGAHTRGYNSYLGIALVGDFSTQDNPTGKKGRVIPTAAQMRSLVELVRRLRQRYNIPLQRIVRHSDISNTYCPGDRFLFQQFLAELEQPAPRGF